MSTDWHVTVRHSLYVIGAIVLGFVVLQHFAPPPAPVHAPVAVFSPSPVEHEAQAAIDALRAVAQAKSGVSVLQQPAIAVIKDTGLVKGLSDAQIAELLAALKPKTVEKVAVGSQLVGPTPSPYSDVNSALYQANYSAITKALAETKIKTDVTITREEVPPSRIGSFISANGSGLSLGIVRKKQYELALAAVARGSHIAPAASVQYILPHTQLGIGPAVIYDHRAIVGIGATIHF